MNKLFSLIHIPFNFYQNSVVNMLHLAHQVVSVTVKIQGGIKITILPWRKSCYMSTDK